MSVSGVSSSGYTPKEVQEAQRAVMVVKKEQDVTKEQAQALADLVKQSTDGIGQQIDVYA